MRDIARNGRKNLSYPPVAEDGSYAQAVQTGITERIGGGHKRVVLSYEAEENDLLKLKKAFIGEVLHPGMTYNIQNAFHSQ
ncbi:hypothetical protein A2U01_0077282, partial [Trifolium medium]|nr:hypothetical protein [Trifolium medium]